MKTSLIVSLIVTILFTIILIVNGYGLVRDIDALVDRAQVSADREDMTEYVSQLKVNLERRGMDRGYFALIFKTPANDLSLHFKTVNRVLERLKGIENIPKNETAYQVALDDIRGTIRELPNPAMGYLWVQYWYLFVIGTFIWIWPFVLFIKDEY